MRRLIPWVLAILVLASAGAWAAPADDAFTMRGGIRWKMSPAEVMAIEGELDEDLYSYEDGDGEGRSIRKLYYDSDQAKTVSLFPCELTFSFCNDQLYMMRYDTNYNFYELDDTQEYLYLMNALDSLYGTCHEPAYDEMLRVVTALEPSYGGSDYQMYPMEDDMKRVRLWNLPGKTTAVLGFLYGRLFLAYFHYNTLLPLMPEDGVYNTDGL